MELLSKWASSMDYTYVMFHAFDQKGHPVYHTNVVMSVGSTLAIVCAEMIPDLNERTTLLESLGRISFHNIFVLLVVSKYK